MKWIPTCANPEKLTHEERLHTELVYLRQLLLEAHVRDIPWQILEVILACKGDPSTINVERAEELLCAGKAKLTPHKKYTAIWAH